MTALPERLQDVIAELRAYEGDPFGQAHHVFREWADRIEAATALRSGGEVVGAMRGVCESADFEAGTLTFRMAGDYYAAAGEFVITPAERAASPAQPSDGWVSVADRLPEHWDHVDVYPDPRDDTYSYYALADGGTNGVKANRWYHNDRDGYDHEIRVTHWRPLTAAPAPIEQESK